MSRDEGAAGVLALGSTPPRPVGASYRGSTTSILPTMYVYCYDVTYQVDRRTPEHQVPVLAQDLEGAIDSILKLLPLERHQLKRVVPRYIGY